MINKIFVLLIAFQVKHFLSDYVWQTQKMLGKFKEKGWAEPLAQHCAVHGLFTVFISIVALFNKKHGLPIAVGLGWLDFWIHFTMDRIKASPHLLGRYKALSAREFMVLTDASIAPSEPDRKIAWRERSDKEIKGNKYFWWSLGLDQLVHHLSDLAIVYFLIKESM